MHAPLDGVDCLGDVDEVVRSVDVSLLVLFLLDMADYESVLDQAMTVQPELLACDSKQVREIVLAKHRVEENGIENEDVWSRVETSRHEPNERPDGFLDCCAHSGDADVMVGRTKGGLWRRVIGPRREEAFGEAECGGDKSGEMRKLEGSRKVVYIEKGSD